MARRLSLQRPRPLELGRRLVDLLGPTGDAARQSLVALVFNSSTSLVAGAMLGAIVATFEDLPGLLVMVPAAIGLRGNIFGAPPGGTRRDLKTLRDFLPLFVNEPLQFAPGTQRQYSNAGYILLGLLVERLSGESYYDYVRKHIYEPAGMTHTAHFRSDSMPAHAALGYTRDGGSPLARNSDLLPGIGSSAGGGYSTAQDLARFVQALREQRVPGGPPSGLGAAGGAPGINAILEGELAGYDLVVMTNLDPPAAERVARMVREWLGVKDEGRVIRRRPGT